MADTSEESSRQARRPTLVNTRRSNRYPSVMACLFPQGLLRLNSTAQRQYGWDVLKQLPGLRTHGLIGDCRVVGFQQVSRVEESSRWFPGDRAIRFWYLNGVLLERAADPLQKTLFASFDQNR